MSDAIDAAVAATAEPAELTVEHGVQFASSGRRAIVSLPVDVTDNEIHELAAWCLLVLPAAVAQARQRAGVGLWVPGKPS